MVAGDETMGSGAGEEGQDSARIGWALADLGDFAAQRISPMKRGDGFVTPDYLMESDEHRN